jgi:hypothetical protein
MKDLDFDELDRAVNSLMKDAPATEPTPKLTDEQTVTISPTLKGDDKPSLANLSQAVSDLNGSAEAANTPAPMPTPTPVVDLQPKPSPITTSTPKQTASVASRRGKFMDVVRPGAVKPETPVRRQSREGISIDPTRPIVNDVTPPSPSPAVQKETAVEPPSVPDVKKEEPVAVSPIAAADKKSDSEPPKEDWPDPIAMAGYEESELPKNPEAEKKPDADAPLVSPFLPDAKVEKRPLGGQPSSALPPEETETEAPTDEEDDTIPSMVSGTALAQLPASPAAEKPLPEELSGDVIALESDANTTASQPVLGATGPVMPEPKEGLKDEPKPEVTTHAPVMSSSTSVIPAVPTGAISIPQQYKEEPSSGDKSTGSIYDTDTYHQPLAHPGKKKSGWMWVIWIILILILGAGAGAALYYFKVF